VKGTVSQAHPGSGRGKNLREKGPEEKNMNGVLSLKRQRGSQPTNYSGNW